MRESLARSTSTASSRSASRARQTPSPYFGRSNTYQSHGRKCVMPDFQDQIAPAGIFQEPDRRVGVHFNDPHCIGISADIGKHVHRGDAEAECPGGLSRQGERGQGTRSFEHRLYQDRVVILRNLIEISNKRGFAVQDLREVAARSEQRLDEGRCARLSEMFERVPAVMTRGATGAVPVMQEEIFAAQRRGAGAFKNGIGEVFVRRQRRSRRVVLRIPRTSPGAEMNGLGLRGNAEHKARSTVDVVKYETELGAGIFGIDRLIRIGPRLSRSKCFKAPHALSGGQLVRIDSPDLLRNFQAKAAINSQLETESRKLIARTRRIWQNKSTAILSPQLRLGAC